MKKWRQIAAAVPNGQLAVWWTVRVSLVCWCLFSITQGQAVLFVQGVVTLAATFLWSLFQRFAAGKTLAKLPCRAQTLFSSFIFLSTVLGNALGFFWRFASYDKLMHLLSGVFVAWLAYDVAVLLQGGEEKANPMLCALLAFFAGAGVAACWEIHEFTMDQLLQLNLQRSSQTSNSGLTDTMLDIIFGTLGGLVTVVCLMLRRKKRKK